MKYIKKNIKIKDGQNIYDDDLNILVPFIRKLQNKDSVEGICLMPLYKQEEIAREPNDYSHIYIKVFVNGELEDYEEIKNSIIKVEYDFCNRYIPVNEYDIDIIDLKEFYKDDSTYSTLCKKALVSSYIIYDKNGTFAELQDEFKNQIHPWAPLVQIENIEELDVKSNSYCDTAKCNPKTEEFFEYSKNEVSKKPTMKIKDALLLLQKIRYYDENGNIVTLMDEHEESSYLSKVFDEYNGTPQQIVRKMRCADFLESIGLIKANNTNKDNSHSIDSDCIHKPLIKIKRKSNNNQSDNN